MTSVCPAPRALRHIEHSSSRPARDQHPTHSAIAASAGLPRSAPSLGGGATDADRDGAEGSATRQAEWIQARANAPPARRASARRPAAFSGMRDPGE
jgi:hypothetical protein